MHEDRKKAIVDFIIPLRDKWRTYREQNYKEKYDLYERIFFGKWKEEDKTRKSERSKLISPASQQAVETRHAEIMEAIFGQGEFFDIKDDAYSGPNPGSNQAALDRLKNQLYDDFSKDKIRKSVEHATLLGEIYGTGIGEIVVERDKVPYPMTIPVSSIEVEFGTGEKTRISVKLVPVNPKNFLYDPNGISVDDCMGVIIEKNVSRHKIIEKMEDGTYFKEKLSKLGNSSGDSLEPTQEISNYCEDRIEELTYYGLIPTKLLDKEDEAEEADADAALKEKKVDDVTVETGRDAIGDAIGDAAPEQRDEEFADMTEAIIIIANDSILLKAVENPYMMRDRPIVAYQADSVPGRLPGRGTVEKALNMQRAIDGSVRGHMDLLAYTVAPMVGMDSTRLPRGTKLEVYAGKNLLTNGPPQEIIHQFTIGNESNHAMNTAKEFERMLLMATGTLDSNGQVSQISRDGIDMASATIIKKYKRTILNFQEDFLIPFIQKALWRYMQFDPQRYPSVDVSFTPTATLGILAREYEQKQLAFLIQTLGANSPLAPILMTGIIKNSSISNREEIIAMLSQPQDNPEEMQKVQTEMRLLMAKADEIMARTHEAHARAAKLEVETNLAPAETKARLSSALARNLNEDGEQQDFERRAKIAELMLKEKDIDSNERLTKIQNSAKVN